MLPLLQVGVQLKCRLLALGYRPSTGLSAWGLGLRVLSVATPRPPAKADSASMLHVGSVAKKPILGDKGCRV